MGSNGEQLAAIAMRIKGLREISGLEAAYVAQRAGIALEDYEAYETGESDFSFSHLFNIAKVLQVDISDLLTGESPKLHGLCAHARGRRAAVQPSGPIPVPSPCLQFQG